MKTKNGFLFCFSFAAVFFSALARSTSDATVGGLYELKFALVARPNWIDKTKKNNICRNDFEACANGSYSDDQVLANSENERTSERRTAKYSILVFSFRFVSSFSALHVDFMSCTHAIFHIFLQTLHSRARARAKTWLEILSMQTRTASFFISLSLVDNLTKNICIFRK